MTKEDRHSVGSEGHPDLNDSEGPSTSKAHMANRNRRIKRVCKRQFVEEDTDTFLEQSDGDNPDESKSKKSGKKRKRLSAYEVSEIILSKGL